MSKKTYTNVGKGSMFFEDTEGNDKRPILKGSVEMFGTKLSVAGWPRVSKSGARYLSVQVTQGEDVVGNGAMFERDNKNRKAPYMNGPVEIQNLKFDFAAWKAKAESSGQEYFRLKIDQITEAEAE